MKSFRAFYFVAMSLGPSSPAIQGGAWKADPR